MPLSFTIFAAIIFSFYSGIVSQNYQGDECKTTDGENGACIPIQDCPSALRGLKMGKIPTQCGFEGHTPIVCCTNNHNPTVTQDPKSAAIVSQMTTSRYHKSKKYSNEVSHSQYLSSTQEPSRINFISLVFPDKDKKLPEPIQKSGEVRNITDSGMSALPSKRKPGEAATYWCKRFENECKSSSSSESAMLIEPQPQRLKRELPDYEDFGTTERPRGFYGLRPITQFEDYPITGGQNSHRNEFPHMAAVGFGQRSDIRWECGGSLISKNFVLTAAHCLIAQDGNKARWVLLGARFVADKYRGFNFPINGVIYHVIRRIRHPGYKRSLKYNDLALLELGSPLEHRDNINDVLIRPACLQVDWDPNLKEATASGWGRLGHGENPSPILQKVQLDILDSSICNETYAVEIRLSKLKKGIDESMICAGILAGGKDTCQGDSGGPLQHKSKSICSTQIIGVTSFGKVCGFAGSPAIYMRISHFIPWIESIVWPE